MSRAIWERVVNYHLRLLSLLQDHLLLCRTKTYDIFLIDNLGTALKEHLATGERMENWNVNANTSCGLSQHPTEIRNHLFLITPTTTTTLNKTP